MEYPENGFYYHFKHDEARGFDDHAYEVCGLTRNTEDKSYFVLYRPLYDNDYMAPALAMVRPLTMFMENVERDGKIYQRFTKITDPELIEKFSAIRDQRYPKN